MNIQEVKKATNKLVEDYNKPTPKKYKKWGKVVKWVGRIVAGLTTVPAVAILSGAGWWIPLAAYVIGETGDLLINLKTE